MLPLSIYIQSYSLCNIFPTGTISESQSVATKVKPTTRDPEKSGIRDDNGQKLSVPPGRKSPHFIRPIICSKNAKCEVNEPDDMQIICKPALSS